VQIKDLNSGTFGFVQLALDRTTGRNVAIKFIERGDKVWRLGSVWQTAMWGLPVQGFLAELLVAVSCTQEFGDGLGAGAPSRWSCLQPCDALYARRACEHAQWSNGAALLQVTKYVEREIINHRQLVHPHIIQFKEVGNAASAGARRVRCKRPRAQSTPVTVLTTGPAAYLQVFLTSQHLSIAMEYAAGGDMFEYVVRKGGLRESEARWFFQQLIVAVDYIHRMVRCLALLHGIQCSDAHVLR
jgi:serine/threonine protein kinase